MSSGNSRFINLRATHPSLLLLYFLSAVVFSMLTMNPAYLLISFLAALLFNFYLEGAGNTLRFIRYFIPLHLLITLANALFSGNGLTVLFFIGNRPVTVESVVYGFSAGLMLLSVLLWFRAYQETVSSDQLLAVGGNRFPVTTLVVGMVLRYVPDTVKHGQTVKMNQNALLGAEKLKGKERVSFFVRMTSILMSWSMENALDTSIAMRSKGYPSEHRNNYQRDRFSKYDAIGIIFILLMIAVQIVGYAIGSHSFLYYPYLMTPPDAPSLSVRISILIFYAIYLFFPFYLELAEWWKRQKIKHKEAGFSGRRKYGLLLDREVTFDDEEGNMKRQAESTAKAGSEYQPDQYDLSIAAELKDVSFTYPGTDAKALNSLSIVIERGSMTLLTGASGSGKTTLLHLLAPSLTPTGVIRGERTIYGEAGSVYEESEKAVQIGFVQQNPDNQIILDSVWHELAFGLENKGLSNQEIERRLAETSTFFGIADWMDRKVSELSGGEKQILNLASSLVMQPDLLLLDEPMAQLDPISRKRFLSMLGRVHDETGTTIVISEHLIDDVLPHADRVVMLENGSIVFDGKPYKYVTQLIETDNKFQISVPLSARMVAKAEKNKSSNDNWNNRLPLTVRDGRQYLINNQEKFEFKQDSNDISSDKPALDQKRDVLCARDIWFRYEKNAPFVLRGANLTIAEGELHALVGGNGSGKSTMMYILSRSLPVLRGSIER
ncbi:MAG: ATP-binding cassette domain-containing protein, partial [Eubacteriales bacterium]|nr:ATP-binding cassette domain-containing protein [Eubacteriales bacterium]